MSRAGSRKPSSSPSPGSSSSISSGRSSGCEAGACGRCSDADADTGADTGAARDRCGVDWFSCRETGAAWRWRLLWVVLALPGDRRVALSCRTASSIALSPSDGGSESPPPGVAMGSRADQTLSSWSAFGGVSPTTSDILACCAWSMLSLLFSIGRSALSAMTENTLPRSRQSLLEPTYLLSRMRRGMITRLSVG